MFAEHIVMYTFKIFNFVHFRVRVSGGGTNFQLAGVCISIPHVRFIACLHVFRHYSANRLRVLALMTSMCVGD